MNDAPWRWVRTLLPAWAALTLVAWGLAYRQWPWEQVALGAQVAAIAAAAGSWRFSARAPVMLGWDGAQWSLDGEPGQADVMIDLGAWLLVRFRPGVDGQRTAAWRAPAPVWLGLSAVQMGSDWHALRVALYAGRAEATGPAHAAGRIP
jgi:hypothetical protein